MDLREGEVDALRSVLTASEGDQRRSDEERAATRKEYERRMAEVLAQLSALRRQLREQEDPGGDKERRRGAARVTQLQQDLARMRAGQVRGAWGGGGGGGGATQWGGAMLQLDGAAL